MRVIAKIVIASAFTLSAIVPAFAAEEDLLQERAGYMSAGNAFAQQVVVKHARAHKAVDTSSEPPLDRRGSHLSGSHTLKDSRGAPLPTDPITSARRVL